MWERLLEECKADRGRITRAESSNDDETSSDDAIYVDEPTLPNDFLVSRLQEPDKSVCHDRLNDQDSVAPP